MSVRAVLRVAFLVSVAGVFAVYAAIAARFVTAEGRFPFRARLQQRGCAYLCRILRVRLRVEGSVSRQGRFLIVSNHFGVLDPFVLASAIQVAFVGKAEITQWPVLGAIARVFGVVFVDRQRQYTVTSFVRDVQDRMNAGVPVLVFPEGTTSGSRHVLPFKTGAFASVVDQDDARVLPVYLRPVSVDGREIVDANRHLVTWAGGNESYFANLLRMAGHRSIEMEVVIGGAFDASGQDRKALARRARKAVLDLAERPWAAADTFAT